MTTITTELAQRMRTLAAKAKFGHFDLQEFIALANPANVLALLDELEATKELVELQRFKLERQAEDLHRGFTPG